MDWLGVEKSPALEAQDAAAVEAQFDRIAGECHREPPGRRPVATFGEQAAVAEGEQRHAHARRADTDLQMIADDVELRMEGGAAQVP